MKSSDKYAFRHLVSAGALLLVVAQPALAQLQVPKCEIRLDEGGRINNASTSSADLSAVASDSRLILGRKVFFHDGTSVSGAFVKLGNGASVFDVDADSLHQGKGATVRGVLSPFSAGGAFCAAPTVDCGGSDFTVPKKGSKSLTPGTYGQVTLGDGASLNLEPGTYSVCQIRTGKHVTVEVTGATQSTINVRDEVRIGDGSTFGPVGSTPTPLLNVAGDTVHIGKHATVQAFITAPSARLDLGDGTTFTGAACVRELSAGRKVNIECVPEVSTTTTTTTPTTTSSSSTTSTLVTTTTTTAPTVTTTTSTTTTSTTTTTLYGSPSRAFMIRTESLLN
jgi:hypothetical protein